MSDNDVPLSLCFSQPPHTWKRVVGLLNILTNDKKITKYVQNILAYLMPFVAEAPFSIPAPCMSYNLNKQERVGITLWWATEHTHITVSSSVDNYIHFFYINSTTRYIHEDSGDNVNLGNPLILEFFKEMARDLPRENERDTRRKI